MTGLSFAALGLRHAHIYLICDQLLAAGAVLRSFYEPDPARAASFQRRYPQARPARSLPEILEDERLALVACAADPTQRAALGMQVMQAGKDFLSAKPGFTDLAQLEAVRQLHASSGRFYAIYYSERLGSPASIRAGELVQQGAIGRVVQTLGLGPHRLSDLEQRPPWTFQRAGHGGILNDLGSHQIEQFLYFTGSSSASIVAAQVGNFHHPQYPHMDDFGDLTLRSDHATGYCRVDWLSPQGLNSWGDVRLFLMGTEGSIEIRKNCDLGHSDQPDQLFWVDQRQTRILDCRGMALPYAAQLLDDLRQRTQKAMPQAHTFLSAELALRAEAQAQRIGA